MKFGSYGVHAVQLTTFSMLGMCDSRPLTARVG